VDFESQLAEIETAFAKPEFYKDSEEVQTTMEKHHQLKADIQLLTEEWEKLTLEAERVNGALAEVQEKG
jgi:regulator of replication initiation timing